LARAARVSAGILEFAAGFAESREETTGGTFAAGAGVETNGARFADKGAADGAAADAEGMLGAKAERAGAAAGCVAAETVVGEELESAWKYHAAPPIKSRIPAAIPIHIAIFELPPDGALLLSSSRE
jgi:hypothetical protein